MYMYMYVHLVYIIPQLLHYKHTYLTCTYLFKIKLYTSPLAENDTTCILTQAPGTCMLLNFIVFDLFSAEYTYIYMCLCMPCAPSSQGCSTSMAHGLCLYSVGCVCQHVSLGWIPLWLMVECF